MVLARHILLAAVPGLMFCIVPAAGGTDARFSWQIVSIWLAGMVFCGWLRSWWLRIFFLLALAQVIAHGPVITAYMTLLMIAIFLAAIQGFEKINPERIKDMLCIAALLLCAWGMLQKMCIVGTGGLGSAAFGPFNIDAGSCFLAICLSAFWRRRWWPWTIAVVLGIFACHSTTGFLAALAASVVFAAQRLQLKGRMVRGLIMVCAALVFFRWCDPIAGIANNTRWPAWQRVIQSYPGAPFGRGLGSFGDVFPLLTASDPRLHQTDGEKIIGESWQHAHCEYLEVGLELGLQAIALVLAFLVWIAVTGFRLAGLPVSPLAGKNGSTDALTLAGIAAAAVGAAGFHIFHIAPTALVGCAWLGIWFGPTGERLRGRRREAS